MPKAAQFTSFDSWKKNSQFINFSDSSYINVRPWTHSSHLPQTAGSAASVHFDDDPGYDPGMSRGDIFSREDGSLTANSAASETGEKNGQAAARASIRNPTYFSL